MHDKKLLELAAKAIGIKIDKSSTNGGGSGNTGFDMSGNAVLNWHDGTIWNPLNNDGDALRLAVALDDVFLYYSNDDFEYCGGDGLAATRRAIVRRAAGFNTNIAKRAVKIDNTINRSRT